MIANTSNTRYLGGRIGGCVLSLAWAKTRLYMKTAATTKQTNKNTKQKSWAPYSIIGLL
jgi:hypothetical protein